MVFGEEGNYRLHNENYRAYHLGSRLDFSEHACGNNYTAGSRDNKSEACNTELAMED